MPNTKQTKKQQPQKKQRKSSGAPKDFNLYKAIRAERHYKSNVKVRENASRKFIAENCDLANSNFIKPGQLVSFDYMQPKYKEELEYYDAMPVTIFFGIVNTSEGKRVLGFNIHYYPPRIRYQLMNRIFEIFKPIYLKEFEAPLKSQVNHFNYQMLIDQLQKAGLEFGIRMYIPKLIKNIRPIAPQYWSKAVFTEGRFMKKTRELILKYWKTFADKKRNGQSTQQKPNKDKDK